MTTIKQRIEQLRFDIQMGCSYFSDNQILAMKREVKHLERASHEN